MTDPQMLAWLDQEDSRLAQTIRAHRVAVQYVVRGEGSDEPPFGYTVGLFGAGHPELVVVGVDHETACAMLNTVADLVFEGRDLVPGELVVLDRDRRFTVETLPKPRRRPLQRQPLLPATGRVLRAGVPAHVGPRRGRVPLGARLPLPAGVPAAAGHVARLSVTRGRGRAGAWPRARPP